MPLSSLFETAVLINTGRIRVFEESHPLYGDWLALDAIKKAARRHCDKEKKAPASVTSVDVTRGKNGDSRNSFEYGDVSISKKYDIKEANVQKRIMKEAEKNKKKRSGNTNAVRKHIVKVDLKKQAKYEALLSKAKDGEKYTTAKLKIWYSVRKMKGGGVIPSKAEEVRAYAKMLTD